jgi:hypothetical protein
MVMRQIQFCHNHGFAYWLYSTLRNLRSVANPLHVIQKDLLAASVIEFGGPAVGVAGDSLSGFKSAVIFQKIRDAGRPE